MDKETNNNLLEKLEKISSGARGSGLEPGKLSGPGMNTEPIKSFLGINDMQAILFSIIVELSLQYKATLGAISKELRCTVLKIMSFNNELEKLEKKGYIKKISLRSSRKNVYADKGYAVPERIIDALSSGDRSLLVKQSKFDLPGFLRAITDLVTEREDELITTDSLFNECALLIEGNRHLSFVKFIDSRLKETSSKVIVFALSYAKLTGLDNINLHNFASAVFDDLGMQLDFKKEMKTGTGELMDAGYLGFFDVGIENDNTIFLTKRIDMMLQLSFPGLRSGKKKTEGIIECNSIKEQNLFFTGKTGEDIKNMEKVLKPVRFRKYVKELKNNNLNPGITAIFHGAPGTGKTELVYQLGRKTGRDIMKVDLSKTKSKWFGESEKIIKQIFNEYRDFSNSSHLEPILFINEGDGLFTHRLSLENGGTSTDFAVNTIQNVLLQELEDFEGIFITTTNMAANLDRAFERRITFKIEFHLPDALTRKKIWKNKVPELKPKQAAELGARFKISGGDIDIAVRKLLLQKVLDKNTDIYTAITASLTDNNRLNNNKKIGFDLAPQIGYGPLS